MLPDLEFTPLPESPPVTPTPRQIYRYHNGTKTIHADPAVLWRKLNAACVAKDLTWDKVCENWMGLAPKEEDDPSTASEKAVGWLVLQEVIAEVVRNAFSLQPLDEEGHGLTEAEVMGVLAGFMEDREKKDVNTES